MIKKLDINRYRKLEGLELNFSENINLISGTNGTCKTSLLHMISNSFQVIETENVEQKKALTIIANINTTLNSKIETLARGDKSYNDPARGHKGVLYSVTYSDDISLEFRRHTIRSEGRFAVKPLYPKGQKQKLPHRLVIYLGLSRLYPFGELSADDTIRGTNKKLPDDYQDQLRTLYNQLVRINITSLSSKKIGNIKRRADFLTSSEGIDSNTISDGRIMFFQ